VRDLIEIKLTRRFALIETGLTTTQDYLMGKRFTVADAYLFTVPGWMKGLGIDLSRWPKLF
jgi:glutathione S-transferase